MELDGEDAIADIDQAGAGIAADDFPAISGRLQNLETRRTFGFGLRVSRFDGSTGAFADLAGPGRSALDAIGADGSLPGRFGHLPHANRLHGLDRAELPAKAPLHRAVDVGA